MRRGDDRAVTVQIGAVLLLAILFSALALYQINVVPEQNADVEIAHNQEVQNELQDLRNGIRNAGLAETPRATSVTLGTQYPTRTVTTNPPAPRGTLETTAERTITFENADVESGNDDLIDDQPTTLLAYEPGYNEYRNAPTTRIEHAVAFNDFGDAAVQFPDPDQQLVDGDRITIVLLTGELSETSSGTVSVDTEPVGDRAGTARITRDNPDENIVLTIPTASPEFWTTALENEPDATATGYDSDTNQLTIELEREWYDLRMSTVGIGEYDATDGFTIPDDGDSGAATPPYTAFWNDPSGQSSVDDGRCSATSCVVTGESVELTMDTDGVAAQASVDYAVSDPSVGTVSPSGGVTDGSGTDSTTFEVASDASDGETVDVYTSSGIDTDTIQLEISRELEITTFDVTDNSDTETDQAAFDVAYAVEDNDGNFEDFDRVEITFENLDDSTATQTDSSPETSGQFEYQQGGAYGDTYRITLQVIDTDGEVVDERVEEYVADGEGSPEPDPGSSLEIGTFDVTDDSDAERDRATFTVDYAVDDTDGNYEEFDRVEIAFENLDADGTWADREDSSEQRSDQFTYDQGGTYGDTYQITLQVYETDGTLADEATREETASGNTYAIDSISLAAGSGNNIDVTVDVETSDPNADMVVRSLQSNGNERDRVTVEATDGTYSVGGSNQADEVQVILRDGDGTERDSQTEPWNG